MEGVDEAELLDRGQGGAVAELHGAGAEPDGGGGGGRQGQDDRRGRARHPGVEMVFGEPVAGVSEAFGLPGEVDGVAQGLGGGRAGRDRHQVQDAEGDG